MSRFQICKNEDGVYRVKLFEPMGVGLRQDGFKPNPGRWLTDTDLMTAVIGSHRTKTLNFSKESLAYRAIADYLDKQDLTQAMMQARELRENPPPEPVVSDTFKEI